MTRDEQMKFYWEKLNIMHKIDPHKYFYNFRSGVINYAYLHPGQSPLFLHFQMFHLAVEKLASEE